MADAAGEGGGGPETNRAGKVSSLVLLKGPNLGSGIVGSAALPQPHPTSLAMSKFAKSVVQEMVMGL